LNHILNAYKGPSQDDGDIAIKPNKGVVKGLWDDGDANDLGQPGRDGPDSVTLSSMLGELCKGNIYVNVHGLSEELDQNGDRKADSDLLRGNLEPTDKGEKICYVLDKLDLLEVEYNEHEPHN